MCPHILLLAEAPRESDRREHGDSCRNRQGLQVTGGSQAATQGRADHRPRENEETAARMRGVVQEASRRLHQT